MYVLPSMKQEPQGVGDCNKVLFIFSVVPTLGWAPSTFVSSRSKKSDTPASRHPENYMDDEVCHGIGI